MKSPSLSMIGLATLVVALAVDFAWLRRAVLRGPSLFGFDAPGLDGLILPMATILAVGFLLILAHRGPGRRFLLGFEACGCLAILAYAIGGWVSPTSVRALLRPVYLCWGFWSDRHPPEAYLFPTTTFLITGTQGLMAAAGGWLAENRGKPLPRVPRVQFAMRTLMIVVAIAALGSMGLARWLQDRQANDPWSNAVRWAGEHEVRATEHLDAAGRYPETAKDRLRMAKYEKMAAGKFQAEAKRLKP